MPKPIVCLSVELGQFLEVFRAQFSKRQWKYFVTVLLGLIECEERRTMTGLLRTVGERISLSGLSRFLNKWPWSAAEVATTWLLRFRQRMEPLVQAEHLRQVAQTKRAGRHKATVVTGYLIFDDSVHTKPKGRKMGGLGKHYSTAEHRVVKGHCLFSGFYILLGQRCPLQPRLYRQQEVCQQTEEVFQSKVAMAIEEIEHFQPVPDTQTHVLVDSWYHCQKVRKAARQRGWAISGGLKSNRVMRRIATDGRRQWLKCSEYAAGLTAESWQEVTWPSAEGGQRLYAHLVSTWIHRLGPTLLLITKHSLDEPLQEARYWGSTVMTLDAQSLLDVLAQRWEIETFFEYEKDLLGSDHYQVMTAQAVVRFWTLTACLLCYLQEQRAALPDQQATCGDARRMIQDEHRANLLRWFQTQFLSGLTVDQVRIQLAL